MEKKNREQRRREKFGHAGGATTDPWPQSEANPVFGQADQADAAKTPPGDKPTRTGDTAPPKAEAAKPRTRSIAKAKRPTAPRKSGKSAADAKR
jgi:hypothetical protein